MSARSRSGCKSSRTSSPNWPRVTPRSRSAAPPSSRCGKERTVCCGNAHEARYRPGEHPPPVHPVPGHPLLGSPPVPVRPIRCRRVRTRGNTHTRRTPDRSNTMNTLSEGDLIEATLGDTVLRGRLNRFEQMPGVGRTPASLDLDGYRVRLIEKAVPALPTAPGFYLDALGYCWALEREGNRP